jgi:hypothetical protein
VPCLPTWHKPRRQVEYPAGCSVEGLFATADAPGALFGDREHWKHCPDPFAISSEWRIINRKLCCDGPAPLPMPVARLLPGSREAFSDPRSSPEGARDGGWTLAAYILRKEICVLRATPIKKGSEGKSRPRKLGSSETRIITEAYESAVKKKGPSERTGIVMHRNFRFWTLSNSGRVSWRASLACVSSLDLALPSAGPSFYTLICFLYR